ncbi:MAG: ATP-binding cassette domain-containing protein, partial [Acidimicrobiia bacterium]|nr:ATP-binding cassette domain-containing protein [Acidimicrobiia bacterium]
PALLGDTTVVSLLTSSVGLLLILLFVPGGLVELARRLVDRFVRTPPAATAGATSAERGAPPAAKEAVPARPMAADHALTVAGATVRFGGLVALDGVDLTVRHGEAVGLIGANGAGKTTLLNAVSGFQRLAAGDVRLGDASVALLRPHERAHAGLARQFQDGRLFAGLTVEECVLVALEAQLTSDLIPSLLALGSSRRGESEMRRGAEEILTRVHLSEVADRRVGELSTGMRRVLELACLSALQPSVILLDEPTAGIAQREAEAFGPVIRGLQEATGASILLVEHALPVVVDVCDRVYCLDGGRVIAEGPPEEVRRDTTVIAAYLGTRRTAVPKPVPSPP